ncbi:2-oxo-4-hydroxy-4-carboxy-5-ureidoimidazoline decarboxylase [Streptomyces meridianus]|uniref:2-oxo-4-hydroxy-4-carboxy-5-ureidoimidazoline decarboxylase n=1 Tax=Streptomyces meridianus TaxID=2938945 RepID=A0ABT0X2A7_9ACTN|nr:2-oxo-4-hydroxy-4-carboxy-5-ureidoimidazoline decarboxylase [Streptomyces meridianus]MCM2576653.1 2-oxo-4-hydroxy-4-carboxy-5-ureidoimidazoline decarboxylase [Streptomyces meridianus]
MTSSPTPGLSRLNTAEDSEARAVLRKVCTSSSWTSEVLARRPYEDLDALLSANDAAMAGLTADDLDEAMAGHPPIGRPEPGDPASTREQRGMADAPEDLKTEMRELNLAYQQRFGHVFLICASGLGAEQMREAIRHRIDNAPAQEREIVRTQLGLINRIRLTRLAEEGGTA